MFYMKCVILKVLSIMERSDLCVLILKGACEYFWRWVNDHVPRTSFCVIDYNIYANQNITLTSIQLENVTLFVCFLFEGFIRMIINSLI